jgi:hypothetical protein
MTETPSTNRQFYVQWLFPFLIRPRQVFEHVLLRKATWIAPLLVISLLMLGQVLFIASRNGSPSDFVPVDGAPMEGDTSKSIVISGGTGVDVVGGMSPEGMVTETSSSGWLGKLIPAVGKLAGLWIGWFILTVVLFVALVISGSQGTFTQALNLTAWSSLPYAIQLIAQILFVFVYSSAATIPQGLAGLGAKIQGTGGQILSIFLQRLDIFLIWQVVLLMIGTVVISQLPAGKVRWLVLLAIIIYLVLAALPAFGMEQFSLLQNAAQPKY